MNENDSIGQLPKGTELLNCRNSTDFDINTHAFYINFLAPAYTSLLYCKMTNKWCSKGMEATICL